MTDIIIAVIGAGGWFSTILIACLNRRWKKQDDREAKKYVTPEDLAKTNATLSAVAEAQKVLMAHEIRCIGSSYIYAGEISLEDKETLDRMYDAYMALPGADGLCGTVKSLVDKLPVTSERGEDHDDP